MISPPTNHHKIHNPSIFVRFSNIGLMLGLTLILSFPVNVFAADLMDIFRSARSNDPGWEAEKLLHERERLAVQISESSLQPKIALTGSIRNIRTSGNGAAILNPAYLDGRTLVTCLQRNGADCDPPLIIRDDVGGRFDTYTTTLQLTQPLYNYGLWRQNEKTKILVDQSKASFESAKQDLIISVAEAYFSVLQAHEEWEQNKAEIESSERQLEQTEKRFRLGLLPQSDVYDVRSSLDSSKVQLLIARTTLENAQENLMLITQRRDVSLATLSDKLLIEAPKPSNVEAWVKKGLTYNRTLLSAHSATLAAEQELSTKRGGFHPEIDLIAGYSIAKNDEVAFESAPSVTTTGIGISARYFLYKGGLTTAEVKAAKLNYKRSTELFELARRDVIRKVRNSYRKVSNDVKGVEVAAQAIISSERSLEASRAGYSNGSLPLLNLLRAENDWYQAKADHARSRYSYILDSLRLKHEAGTLTIEDLQVINSWLDENKIIMPADIGEDGSSADDAFING